MKIIRKPSSLPLPSKDLAFVGSSLDDLSGFPQPVRRTASMALHVACLGGKHEKSKPWKGLRRGAFEIVESYDRGTYRAVYTVEFGDCVYVLHAFQKKSKKGIKTPKPDIDLIERRYKAASDDYRKRVKQS